VPNRAYIALADPPLQPNFPVPEWWRDQKNRVLSGGAAAIGGILAAPRPIPGLLSGGIAET
jgi:hypothetical protein